jgi:hypothetical protein
LFPCLTKQHAKKMCEELEVSLHVFLISSLDGRFILGEGPGNYWIWGSVRPRDCMDAVAKKKIPPPHFPNGNRAPVFQPVAKSP